MMNRDTDTISRQQAIDALKEALNPSVAYFVKAKMAIEALPPSPSRPQWIPCSERLPDEHKSVLCCTYGGTHFIGYIKEAKQGEYMAVSGDSDYKTVYEIVAWMPKPEPYHKP